MSRLRATVVLAAVLAAAAAGHASSDTMTATAVQPVFMWQARSETATVWLLGSIHAARHGLYPLDPVIEQAFSEAAVVAFETDLGDLEQAATEMLAAGTLSDGQTLEQVVSQPTLAALRTHLAGSGLPLAGFDTMRPWLVALTLTAAELVRQGYGLTSGIDLHLWRRAGDTGKRRLGLEPVAAQIALFRDLTPAESEAFLTVTLHELDGLGPMLDEITERWLAGDAGRAAELLTESFEGFPRLYQAIVADRNRSWLPHIEQLLAGSDDAMVVVGALHLVGPDSVLALLTARGCDVTQVVSSAVAETTPDGAEQ